MSGNNCYIAVIMLQKWQYSLKISNIRTECGPRFSDYEAASFIQSVMMVFKGLDLSISELSWHSRTHRRNSRVFISYERIIYTYDIDC